MAKLIFEKNKANEFGALYAIRPDQASLDSSGIDQGSYTIIDCSDSDYNEIRLEKCNPIYNDAGQLDISDKNNFGGFADEAAFNTAINGFTESTDYDEDFINSVKAIDWSSNSYPINGKELPELIEEKGVTYINPLESRS